MNGLIGKYSLSSQHLAPFAVKAAWKLGSWRELEALMRNFDGSNFDFTIGRLFLDIRNSNVSNFKEHITQAYVNVTNELALSGPESYERAYDATAKLSALHEIQQFQDTTISKNDHHQSIRELVDNWDKRSPVWTPKARGRIFQIRHALVRFIHFDCSLHEERFGIATYKSFAGEILLKIAKEFRKAGLFEASYSAIIKAMESKTPSASLEKAKWAWAQNFKDQALKDLRSIVNEDASAMTLDMSAAKVLIPITLEKIAGNPLERRNRQPSVQRDNRILRSNN